MTRSSSTATKRRGVALAAAVGVLTLGAAASASAAGPLRTASKGSADVKIATKGPNGLCADPSVKLGTPGKGTTVPKAGKAIMVTKPGKFVPGTKPGETVEISKITKRSVPKDATGMPIGIWKCPGLTLQGEPGNQDKPCKVIEVKGDASTWNETPGEECHAIAVQAASKKR
ncbi:hypothetical protein ACWY4P_36775 [Streptomyces sp. LZ34]